MNTFRFSSSLSTHRPPLSRAQFSPLARRNPAQTAAPAASTPRSPFRVAQTPAFPPLWSSTILDRLQPAVTRYHD